MPVSKGQGLRPGAGQGGGTLPCPQVWKVHTSPDLLMGCPPYCPGRNWLSPGKH